MQIALVRVALVTGFAALAAWGVTATEAEAMNPPPCDVASHCSANYAPGSPAANMCNNCLGGAYGSSAAFHGSFTAANGSSGPSCVPCSNTNVPANQVADCNACVNQGGTYSLEYDECFIGGQSTSAACNPVICDVPSHCADTYPGDPVAIAACEDCLFGDHLLPFGFGAFSNSWGGPSCVPCSNHNIPAGQVASCEACLADMGTYQIDTDECFYGGNLVDPQCDPEFCEAPDYCDMLGVPSHDDCMSCLDGSFGWSAMVLVNGNQSCVPCESKWLSPLEHESCTICESWGGVYSAPTNECFIDGMTLGPC